MELQVLWRVQDGQRRYINTHPPRAPPKKKIVVLTDKYCPADGKEKVDWGYEACNVL